MISTILDMVDSHSSAVVIIHRIMRYWHVQISGIDDNVTAHSREQATEVEAGASTGRALRSRNAHSNATDGPHTPTTKSVYNALRTPITGSRSLKRKPSPELDDSSEDDGEDLEGQEIDELGEDGSEMEYQSGNQNEERESGQVDEEDHEESQGEDSWLSAREAEEEESFFEDAQMNESNDQHLASEEEGVTNPEQTEELVSNSRQVPGDADGDNAVMSTHALRESTADDESSTATEDV